MAQAHRPKQVHATFARCQCGVILTSIYICSLSLYIYIDTHVSLIYVYILVKSVNSLSCSTGSPSATLVSEAKGSPYLDRECPGVSWQDAGMTFQNMVMFPWDNNNKGVQITNTKTKDCGYMGCNSTSNVALDFRTVEDVTLLIQIQVEQFEHFCLIDIHIVGVCSSSILNLHTQTQTHKHTNIHTYTHSLGHWVTVHAFVVARWSCFLL